MYGHIKVVATLLLTNGLLAACGSGPVTASETSSTETSSTETSSGNTDTEAETGGPDPLEPLECPGVQSTLSIDGPLDTLVGSASGDNFQLDRILEAMQTQWYVQKVIIYEVIDGEAHDTELYVDARGGAIVMQSTESDGYVRVEFCELAPLEFFAACAQSFTSECADFANWFGPCTTDGLACPEALDCGVPPACPETPVISSRSDDDLSCVWTALRDAESLAAKVSVRSEIYGWAYWSYTFHLDDQSRNVGLTWSHVDDTGASAHIERCELQPAQFFQACLDAPTPDCEEISTWFHSCVEVPQPCAP